MEWKDIAGYEGLYRIATDGTVMKRDGTVLKGNVNSYGYRVVSLTKNRVKKDLKLHRLLAMAFIENPDPKLCNCVNHIDGNKLNNSLDNLEWCTKGRNNKHARFELEIDWSEKPVAQSTLDGKCVAVWRNASAASEVIGGNAMMISACCKGTSASAYGYKWDYVVIDFAKVTSRVAAARLREKEERLCRELEHVRSQINSIDQL